MRMNHLSLNFLLLNVFLGLATASSLSSCAKPKASRGTSTLQASAAGDRTIGDIELADNPNFALGAPISAGTNAQVLVSRSQYVLSWSKKSLLLGWAAWELRDADLGAVDRSDDFRTDDELKDYARENLATNVVTPRDYTSSCFDRGHQVPSADRTNNQEDNSATFFMSNMIPQTSYLNRGHWARLEDHTRDLIRGTGGKLIVYAGPIFKNSPGYIGRRDNIAVPSKNFKIIVKVPTNGHGAPQVLEAVIMPNTTSTGTDPIADRDQACADQDGTADISQQGTWKQHRTTVAAIEEESGLRFPFLH